MGEPSIFRDPAGNLRETKGQRILSSSANVSTATGFAAVAACTLAASTGNRWVLDEATLTVSNIASPTLVSATISDGTTVLGVFGTSVNGKFDLQPQVADALKRMGASGAGLGIVVSSPGTGGSTTVQLHGHKVAASDV